MRCERRQQGAPSDASAAAPSGSAWRLLSHVRPPPSSTPVRLDAAQQLRDGHGRHRGQRAAEAAARQLLDVHAVCRRRRRCCCCCGCLWRRCACWPSGAALHKGSVQAGSAKLVDKHCPHLARRLLPQQAGNCGGLARGQGARDDVYGHRQAQAPRRAAGGHPDRGMTPVCDVGTAAAAAATAAAATVVAGAAAYLDARCDAH